MFFLHSLAKDVDIQTPERDQVRLLIYFIINFNEYFQIEVHDSGIDFEINGQGGVYNFVITGLGDDTNDPPLASTTDR